MRNKQVIEQLGNKAQTTADLLYKDADAYKPHMTVDYVKQQLEIIVQCLEKQQQYLDLED